MPTPQALLFLPRLYFLSRLALTLLLLAASRYLLLLFTAARRSDEAEAKEKGEGETLSRLRSVSYAMMAWLYCVSLLCGFSLPLQLLAHLSTRMALLTALLLFCACDVVPRFFLPPQPHQQCLSRWGWLIRIVQLLDRFIPVDRALRRVFEKEESGLTRKNVERELGWSGRGVRQEEVELLEKLRGLSELSVGAVAVERKNILVLDIQAQVTIKLLRLLGKYSFSNVLLYSRNEHNVVAYLPFKHLLAFQLGQSLTEHPHALCTRLLTLPHTASLAHAIDLMVSSKLNFALIRNGHELVGLVKLKDIFARLLLKWYNYGGLEADRAFHSVTSMTLSRDPHRPLEEAEEQA